MAAPKGMFGDEPADPGDDEAAEGEDDETLSTLGGALREAIEKGDDLAIARAVRDLNGDKEE